MTISKRLALRCRAIVGLAAAAVVGEAQAATVEHLSVVQAPSCNGFNELVLGWGLPTEPPADGIGGVAVYRDGIRRVILEPSTRSYRSRDGHEVLGPVEHHTYEVVLLNSSGVESPERAALEISTPTCPPPPASIRGLVLQLEFPDVLASADPDEAHYAFFESPQSLGAFAAAASYGLTTLYGDASPLIRMPQPYSAYDSSAGLSLQAYVDALQAAAYVVPGLRNYDEFYFFFTRIGENPHTAYYQADTVQGHIVATGFVTRMPATWDDFSAVGSADAAHEFGHNLGMNRHAGLWKCPNAEVGRSLEDLTAGSCEILQYGDTLDPMGTAERMRDYGAYHKVLAGFVGFDQVATVDLADLTTIGTQYWVDRLEKPSPGLKMLRIHLGGGFYYLVENRHQGPQQFFDQIDKVIVRLKPGYTNGVSGNLNDTFALRRSGDVLFLRPDTPRFTDPYRRVEISVTETRSQDNVHQARVLVRRVPPGGGCGLLGIEIVPMVSAALIATRRRRQRLVQ